VHSGGGLPAADGPQYPDLARVLSVARRRWWVIALAAVACALVAMLTARSADVYTAKTRLLVVPSARDFEELRAAGQQAQTYARLATTRPVLKGTLERLRSVEPIDDFERKVAVKADDVTRLITITVDGESPAGAAAAARALAAQLQSETVAGAAGSGHTMRVVEPPAIPDQATGGGTSKLVVLAFLAGALVALAVLVVVDATQRRIITEDDAAAASPAPALGSVGMHRHGRRSDEQARADDRLVAERILGATAPAPGTVLVASADRESDAGDVTAALARALAQSRRVVVVDADPGGSLTAAFGLDGRPGLGEALAAAADGSAVRLDDVLARVEPRLTVVPCGTVALDDILDAQAAHRLLRRLRRSADVLLLGCGGVDALPGPLDWARLADVGVVVARAGRTSMPAVDEVVDALSVGGTTVGGVVLAPVPPRTRARRPAAPAARREEGEPGRRRAAARDGMEEQPA
jgi:capsular polysaccharide biosynthesis protein